MTDFLKCTKCGQPARPYSDHCSKCLRKLRLLETAASVLDAEVRKVFGEGLESEQRDVIVHAHDGAAENEECLGMLDDMEARMGVNVDAARTLVNEASDDPETRLCAEFEAYCREQKLPCTGDAMELLMEDVTLEQHRWLMNFIDRWDREVQGKND